MVESISQERWDSAQRGEVDHYDYGNEANYKNSSSIILKEHFNIDPEKDLVGKKILESGGGCYPSIYFCKGLKKAVNIEPLYDQFPENVKQRLVQNGIETLSIPFENYSTRTKFDEVWFFNVLTHVMNPELQLEIAKKVAKTVRVFEPIDTAVNNEHPHTLTYEFFEKVFPDIEVKIYNGGSRSGFHQANCVYLTYNS
jgi:hypothetical protein